MNASGSSTPALRQWVESHPFHGAVIALVIGNAMLMGLETSHAVMERWGSQLLAVNVAVQTAFVVEIALRIAAHWPRPLAYFRDGWNVFDFLVVAASLLPEAGPAAVVARTARIMRVGRLVSAIPELRLIIGTMLRSIPSMGHVLLLLALLFYIYGILGHRFFAAADPVHWGSLPRAFDSLFQILTLEGWVEIRRAAGPDHPASPLFYTSFVFVAVFVVVNLFIAVVINNLDTVKREVEATPVRDGAPAHQRPGAPGLRDGDSPEHAARASLARMRAEIDALERALEAERARRERGPLS